MSLIDFWPFCVRETTFCGLFVSLIIPSEMGSALKEMNLQILPF